MVLLSSHLLVNIQIPFKETPEFFHSPPKWSVIRVIPVHFGHRYESEPYFSSDKIILRLPPDTNRLSSTMDGNEAYRQLDEDGGLEKSSTTSTSKQSRRQSSFSNPLTSLKRMHSKLTTGGNKGGLELSNPYSSMDLLTESIDLPQSPKPPKEGNGSKESLFSRLNSLADHPTYHSNPAPGLGYSKSFNIRNLIFCGAAQCLPSMGSADSAIPHRTSKADNFHRKRIYLISCDQSTPQTI